MAEEQAEELSFTSKLDVDNSSLAAEQPIREASNPNISLGFMFKGMLSAKSKQDKKLLSAADNGDLNRVKEALSEGADINAKGHSFNSALERAGMFGHEKVMLYSSCYIHERGR